jgi:hypothetical protein
MASWQALMTFIAEHKPALSGEWRYYHDGKSWLYKATHKGCDLASPPKKQWFSDLGASVQNRVGEMVLGKWTPFREIEGDRKLSTTEGTSAWMLTSQHDVWQDSVSSRV